MSSPLALLVLGGLYLAALVLSDSKTFGVHSPAVFILVPDILESEALRELGEVIDYRYSAADGPKPAVMAARLRSRLQSADLEGIIQQHFANLGFEWRGSTFGRDEQEITWSYEKEAGVAIVEIALLNYTH